MKKILLSISFCLTAVSFLIAQQRYLDEVFSSVLETPNITYGQNLSVLTGSPQMESLKLDLYEPSGDSLTARPLILVLHTGSFLPAVINGQPTGSRKDSAVVEMCRRFAKKGYVAAAVSYRLGWNPISPVQEVRTGTLINAAYRGVQDVHTAVRFLKMEAATYKIDSTKIVVGGIGTGGYVSLAFDYFDKISELNMAKFVDFSQSPPKPYIDTALSGDFKGTLARPLNNPNHLGFSSDVSMVFNCGGALGDSSWLEAGDIPVVAFHCTKDPNAPYTTGAVIVPTTGDFVVEASGSYDVLRIASEKGVNSPIEQGVYNDVYTTRANQVNDGYEGLFPFVTPAPQPAINCNGILLPGQEQGAPWDWWDEATYKATITAYNGMGLTNQNPDTMACNAKRGNPDMSAAKGRTYIDTIQGYLAPRMITVLALTTGINTVSGSKNIFVYPNPSNSLVNVDANGKMIHSVEICNIAGQTVVKEMNTGKSIYSVSKEMLGAGIYFIKVEAENESSIHKVVIF